MNEKTRLSNMQILVQQEYGIVGEITRLAGENENYQIIVDDGSKYVLKTTEDSNSVALIELENKAVEITAASCPDLDLPRLINTKDNKIAVLVSNEKDPIPVRARLLSYVEGTSWFDDLPVSVKRCRDFGCRVAQLDLAMSALESTSASHTHEWDLARAGQHRRSIDVIEYSNRRQLVSRAFELWSACAEQFFGELPHSVIHGDLNDDIDDTVEALMKLTNILAENLRYWLILIITFHILRCFNYFWC